MVLEHNKGLYQRWLEIEEASGKPLKRILDEINAACGTSYKHNWPSKMAESGYSMERTPKAVRRYMMRRVLPVELAARDVSFPQEVVEELVRLLT